MNRKKKKEEEKRVRKDKRQRKGRNVRMNEWKEGKGRRGREGLLRVRNGNLIFRLYFPLSPRVHTAGNLAVEFYKSKSMRNNDTACLPACPSLPPFSAWFSIRNPRLSSEECALGGFPPPPLPPLPPLPLLRRVALGIIVRVVRELVKTGERKRGGWKRLFLIRERGRQIYGNDIGNVKEERGLVKW